MDLPSGVPFTAYVMGYPRSDGGHELQSGKRQIEAAIAGYDCDTKVGSRL